MKLQNAAKTSSDQIREEQIGRQLSEQRSSLETIQLGSDIQRLSNDLQNLNQGVAASSQARTLEKSLEESNKFTQQEIELNRRVTENHQKQSGDDRNTDKLAATQIEQKNTNERFKDSLTTTLEQKKDQEGISRCLEVLQR